MSMPHEYTDAGIAAFEFITARRRNCWRGIWTYLWWARRGSRRCDTVWRLRRALTRRSRPARAGIIRRGADGISRL